MRFGIIRCSILLFFLFVAYLSSYANKDSLMLVLKKEEVHDTALIQTNIMLSKYYWYTSSDSALLFCENAQKIAEKIDEERWWAEVNYGFATAYVYSVGDYKRGLSFMEQSIKSFEKHKVNKRLGHAYLTIGTIGGAQGEYENAIKYFQKALEHYQKTGDISGESSAYNNLGVVHYNQQNYKKALEYYGKSIAIKELKKDKQALKSAYQNLAGVFYDLNQLDSAIFYIEKSLNFNLELNDLSGAATAYNGMAMIYRKVGDFKKSIKYDREGLKLSEKIGDLWMIANAHHGIAMALTEDGNYKEAIQNLEKSIEINLKIGAKRELSENYGAVSEVYKKMNDHKSALKYKDLYIAIKDSLVGENTKKNVLELEKKYETELKEKEISELKSAAEISELKLEQNKILNYAFSIGIALLIIIALAIFYAYRQKSKLNEKLEIKNTEISSQKDIIETKNREITQSIQYAQKIQSALIPNEEIFKKTLPDSFIIFKPKDIVSGDFYWLSDREDYIFYATADSTGHGVPGGFMSMLGTALLNEIIDERKVKDCGEVLTLMREKIIQALKQTGDSESKDGMDMVLIRIDKKTLKMEYAAANNSFYIIRNNQLLEQDCDKMPVGVYHSEVKPFQTFTHQLQKGDVIYTYTDGYADQFGGNNNKKYTYKKFREKFLEIENEPLSKQKMILENEFESWKSNNEQVDDVCVIGVRV